MLCVCRISFSPPEYHQTIDQWNHNQRKKKRHGNHFEVPHPIDIASLCTRLNRHQPGRVQANIDENGQKQDQDSHNDKMSSHTFSLLKNRMGSTPVQNRLNLPNFPVFVTNFTGWKSV